MQNLSERASLIGITALMAVSFLALNASKYDTADKVWLFLLLGAGIFLIPIFLGFSGFRKHAFISMLLGFWCLLIWISYNFSQTKNYGFSEAVIFSVTAVLGICLTTISKNSWRTLINILIFFAIISALYGFWYFPTHGESRIAGLFLDASDPRHFFPNAFANFLLMVWPLALITIQGRKKSLIILSCSILLTALYLTFSRGAWTVFSVQIVGLAIYFLKYGQIALKKIFKPIIFIVILTTIFVSILLHLRNINFSTTSLIEKITFKNSEYSTSLNERKDFWLGSLQLIRNKPLAGYGPMSFRYAYPQVQKDFLAISDHPHNWILKIGVENGLVAALAFALFVIAVTFSALKKSRKNPAVFILLISFLAGFLHNMLDYNMNFIPTLLAFFLIAGCIISYSKINQTQWLNKISVILVCAIVILTTLLSLNELQTTFARKLYPENPLVYKSSFIPRDFFINEAQKLINEDKQKEAKKFLNIHLSKNPLDAQAWYLKGDYEQALKLDPMNYFAYYRAVVESNKNEVKPEFKQKILSLLEKYELLLAANIHYTAFSRNPIEAARLYKIFGKPEKAAKLLEKTEKIKKEFSERNFFNKQLGPRKVLELFLN